MQCVLFVSNTCRYYVFFMQFFSTVIFVGRILVSTALWVRLGLSLCSKSVRPYMQCRGRFACCALHCRLCCFVNETILQQSWYCVNSHVRVRIRIRGVATGGISVYIPPKISNRFVHVWAINTCFAIAMTS